MSKITVGEYPNGKVEFIDGAYVYVPNNVSSSTDVTIYYPGAISDVDRGDILTPSDYINTLLEEEGFDKIIILSDPDYRNMFSNEYLNVTTESNNAIVAAIEEEYNVSLDKVNTMGASAGDKCALHNFADLCKNGKDAGFCVITGASTIDGAQTEGQPYRGGPNRAFLTEEEYAAIEGRTVFIFESEHAENYSYVQQLVAHGVDVVLVECKNGNHDPLSYKPLEDNIFALLDGDPTAFIESDNYTFKRCTDKDNNIWETMDNEDLLDTVRGQINPEDLLKKDVISINDLFIDDGFEIIETTSESLAKYQYLKDMDASISIRLNPSIDPTIASNMIYVANTMTNLRSSISSSNFLNAQTMGFRSSTGIPGCISVYLDKYYNFVGQLMESLIDQTEAVVSVGQAIVDMDADLQKKGEEELGNIGLSGELSEGNESEVIIESKDGIIEDDPKTEEYNNSKLFTPKNDKPLNNINNPNIISNK